MSLKIARYVALFYAAVLLLTMSVLVIIVVAVTVVESVGKLGAEEGAAEAALALAMYSTVEYTYQVLPLACLLGALIAGTLLAQRGEILAIFAAGMSPRLLLGAAFSVVAVASAGGMALGEWAVPWAVAGTTRTELRRSDALSRYYTRESKWLRKDDFILYLPMVDTDQTSFVRPVLYRFAGPRIVEVLEAETLHYRDDQWQLEAARKYDLANGQRSEAAYIKLDLTATPSDLADIAGDPRQLQSDAVATLIKRREKAGFDVTAHKIELNDRRAFPLSCLWMFLVVAPWAFRPERRRSLAVNLGVGVVLVAVLLSLTQVWRMLALSHLIPIQLGGYGMTATGLLLVPASLALAERYRKRGSLW